MLRCRKLMRSWTDVKSIIFTIAKPFWKTLIVLETYRFRRKNFQEWKAGKCFRWELYFGFFITVNLNFRENHKFLSPATRVHHSLCNTLCILFHTSFFILLLFLAHTFRNVIYDLRKVYIMYSVPRLTCALSLKKCSIRK